MIMKNNHFNDFFETVDNYSDFLILIHDKPDGDAVGSSTALALFLNKIDKRSAVLSPSEIPKRLEFAKNGSVTYLSGKSGFEEFHSAGCIISVDIASNELLSGLAEILPKPIAFALDHHRVNTLTAEHKYVDENAAACGEILFHAFSAYAEINGIDIFDKSVCEALYTSISSDTGCFKYGNTTPQSHTIAAELMSCGVNAEVINRNLFDIKTLTQIKTEQLAYRNIKMYYNNKLAVVTIDAEDLKSIGATEEDTETISQLARMIFGVEIGVMMREKPTPDGRMAYKFSVRANSNVDVSVLCGAFGGGGHKKAAGCTIANEKEKALCAFVAEAEKYIL